MAKKEKHAGTTDVFDEACERIVDEIQAMPLSDNQQVRKLGGIHAIKLRKSVEKFVRDSVPLRFKKPAGYASVRRNSNSYSKGALGPHFTYRITVKRAFDGMVKLGYLRVTKAGVSDGPIGRYLTRYEATEKLMAFFEAFDAKVLPALVTPDPNEHPIRVRQTTWETINGQRKKLSKTLPTPDTKEVEAMKARLCIINSVLLKNWFDLEISDEEFGKMQSQMLADESKGVDVAINMANRGLYRVFNDKELTRGGRYYGGWWQNIPSKYRAYMIINCKPMVEYDYSGLHPSILYAERNLAAPEDPYSDIIIPRGTTKKAKKEARDVAKKIFNAMINAKKPMLAQPDGVKLSDFGMKWSEVSERVQKLHEPIADAFYSDSGARLQRLDSDLAEEVMLHFATKGVAVLPVHDSFLVHSGYEAELEQVMIDAFKKRFGIKPKLKTEPRSVRVLSWESTSQEIEDVIEYMSLGHEMRYQEHLKKKK